MNSRELVSAALAGRRTARVPVGPLAVHFCAGVAGISVRDYTLDPDLLCDSVVRYYERFQPDAVWLSADTWVNAQAMGAAVAFPSSHQPLSGTGVPMIFDREQIRRIPPPPGKELGRWPVLLKAMDRLRARLGDEVFIVGCFDQYPFSLACQLLGIEKAMISALEDRPMIEELMEHCSEYTVTYGLALAEAGADMISGGDSPAGLLGPALYRDLAFPFEKAVIEKLRSRTSLPVSLHICGNALPLLRDMAETGAQVLELDHLVDLRQAVLQVPSEIAIWGNLDPVRLLARGTPEAIVDTARSSVELMEGAGHRRFVLSSGCTLAMETPEVNLRALIDFVKSYKKDELHRG